MLRNLVGNALAYTPRGRVLVAVRKRGAKALVQVWDTGIGIPEDQLALIFNELHQVANQARDRSKGLGLGLSIVQRLGKALGFEVRVRSALGKGSVFSFEVPLAAPGVAGPEWRPEAPRVEPRLVLPPGPRWARWRCWWTTTGWPARRSRRCWGTGATR